MSLGKSLRREQVALALSVISGRVWPEDLSNAQLRLLGYDRRPDAKVVVEACEEILLAAICPGEGD